MDTVDAGNKSDAIGKHFGFSLPKLTFEKTQQTENPYPGLDLNHSILVACDSNSTIKNCLSGSLTQGNRGFSLNEGTILGSNDVFIGGQISESRSAKLVKLGTIEMILGAVLDNGAPLIGGALAPVTGGAGILSIPAIQVLGVALQMDGAAKIVTGSALAVSEGNWWDDYENDDSPRTERIGKSRGNAPRNNQAQNEQVDAVSKKYGLTKDERRLLHDMIGKQGNGYSELEELAREIKDMRK